MQRRRSSASSAANGAAKPVSKASSPWLAPSASKRWGELFFLAYSPVWIVFVLLIVVPFQIYERFKELEYFLIGLLVACPCFVVPFFIVGEEDRKLPWYRRYWAKANLWIAIFGYVGNYFWTHYFYTVLGATYTFPSWKLNGVPLVTYFMTHAYFLFYHTVSNLILRRLSNALRGCSSPAFRWAAQALCIFVFAYTTALTEALTIAYFPYYEIVDRPAFYKVGSLFYAIYFFVSFPMFARLDEAPGCSWTTSQTAVDSLAAAMLVTIVLDLWRISLGPIVHIPGQETYKACLSYGLPWLR